MVQSNKIAPPFQLRLLFRKDAVHPSSERASVILTRVYLNNIMSMLINLEFSDPNRFSCRGTGISGTHNRFTHYACPIKQAVKTNSGSRGTISNMVPSLQHVYTVSILLGKVEYVARRNAYDRVETIDERKILLY